MSFSGEIQGAAPPTMLLLQSSPSTYSCNLRCRLALRTPAFASASLPPAPPTQRAHAFDLATWADHVAKTMAGTFVYTVSNSSNEFVLVSDPNNGMKSLSLLCFR